jgi:hypothetical protein
MQRVSSAANSEWVYPMMTKRPKHVVDNLQCTYTKVVLTEINTTGNTTQRDGTTQYLF